MSCCDQAEWRSCPEVETPAQERERTTKAAPGRFEAKVCPICGRVQVRDASATSTPSDH